MTTKRKPDFSSQQVVCMSENESILMLEAFILDTKIENPEGCVIANGKNEVLLSELFAQKPDIRQGMIEERAEVFRKLGWEVPKC